MKENDEQLKNFEETWSNPKGFWEWFSTVNNQPLAERFMVTSIIFFIIAGFLGILMRIQLAVPNNDFIGPLVYNQIFTMHGSTMMFLFAVPFLEGLGLYIIPLMIGSRDVAFPRLSAFSYWTYLLGGIFFFVSFFTGTSPDSGWFAYTPLSGPQFSGLGVDFWVLGLGLVEIAGIATGIELAVTILKLRSPGMALNRIPIFAWTILVISIMIVFAFTVLLVATLLLECDRMLGTHFFNPAKGGNSLLWQHLFWFFGHPEVYIMFLPATGIVSTIVASAAKRKLVGYTLVALAVVVTGFVSFGLWVHHMFATGLPELAASFFTAASLIIATASGVQIFAWIATLWGSRPKFNTPFLFVLGFLTIFVLGGLTGVMVAVVPFDWQVHDTYFIVAHFHYVLIGGVVFPVFAAISYWGPKITGKLMNDEMGVLSFWIMFAGFNLTFFPMHIMGLLGMPRRVYTFSPSLGINQHNWFSTIGAFVMGVGVLFFFINFLLSLGKVKKAPSNPWEADSFEWGLPSPPPIYAFKTPPTLVKSEKVSKIQSALTAAPEFWRGTLVTSSIAGNPQAIQWLPGPSYTPIFAAFSIFLILLSIVTKLYLLSVVAAVSTIGFLLQWMWPTKDEMEKFDYEEIEEASGLTTTPSGHLSPAWWGTIFLLTVLFVAFSALAFTYFYLWLHSSSWPQEGLALPDVSLMMVGTGLLVASLAPLYWSKKVIVNETHRLLNTSLIVTLSLGSLSIISFLFHISMIDFAPSFNAYSSIFYVLYWFLLGVLLMGITAIVFFISRIWSAKDNWRYSLLLQVQITNMLWGGGVVLSIFTSIIFYVVPGIIT